MNAIPKRCHLTCVRSCWFGRLPRIILCHYAGAAALGTLLWLGFASACPAAITVLDYYRLGENDPGAASGNAVNSCTRNTAGTNHLAQVGGPRYTNDVPIDAGPHTGSTLAVDFNGVNQSLTNHSAAALTDNFGIEAWVKARNLSGPHVIAYTGNSTANGWGLVQIGANFQGGLGGSGSVGSAPATNNAWTHLALVRENGTATLYLNGVPAGSSTAVPALPDPGFAIGAHPQGPAGEFFDGTVDEVRVFTFSPGGFSTNDLLVNSPVLAGNPQDGFNPRVDGAIKAMVVQPDGKIVIGGEFTMVNGQAHSHIARLNHDGTLDGNFNCQANGTVWSVAVQADAKILLGGSFATVNGVTRNHIARLEANGGLDDAFDPGADDNVLTLAVQPDEKVLVGGSFTLLGNQPRHRIARLNPEGSLDMVFNPGASNYVINLTLQPDGKILVGGYFTNLAGVSRGRLGRLNTDGSLDGGFDPAADNYVYRFAVQNDGKILVGGAFTELGGQPRHHLGRLNANGSLDMSFDPGTDLDIADLALQADGKILVGGGFSTLAGQTRTNIGRLNMDGSLDVDFDPGADGAVVAFAVQPDGNILAGGYFSTLAGHPQAYLGRLTAGGRLERTFDPGADSWVLALATQPDSKILVGGMFYALGGETQIQIGRLNADGTRDPDFNPVVDDGGAVRTLAVQSDGRILAGGLFGSLNGQPRKGIARLNRGGTLDMSFDPGAIWEPQPFVGKVNSLIVQPDGKILVGGLFSSLGGGSRTNIGRLNSDGTLDGGFNPGARSDVIAMALQADGKILVGGYFEVLGGQQREYLGRLNSNGTLDDTFNPGADFTVYTMAVQADGKILVGGQFTMLAGKPRNHIGRLNPDGSLDMAFDPGADWNVNDFSIQADGKILAGGLFNSLAGQPRHYIARLNADGSLDPLFNPGANGAVYCLASQADGKVLAGGEFTLLGGLPRNHIGRLSTGGAALQSLQMNGTSLTWSRSGTPAELEQVRFGLSFDGTNFTDLGPGARIDGGWRLAGVSAPAEQNFFVSAHGRASSGLYNGSGGMIETVRQFFLPTRPQISNLAILPGGAFQFEFTNSSTRTFTVFAATNVDQSLWTPLGSAFTDLGGGVFRFTDSSAANFGQRFYQLRSP